MFWGLSCALSVMAMVPARVPVTDGVNVTATVQLAPASSEFPQVFVWLKSPLVAITIFASGWLPVSDNVTSWGKLPTPTSVASKVRVRGARLTAGPEVKSLATNASVPPP